MLSFRALLSLCALLTLCACAPGGVPASLLPWLVNHYTFDDPVGRGGAVELDHGIDATNIDLVNGAPRVADPAWGGSSFSLETGQRNTGNNDDWKAGVMFPSSAASTLTGTNHVTGVTIAGWFKPLGGVGNNPSPNTNTGFPGDYFNAFGLAGLLRGDDDGDEDVDGHAVRALIEVIGGKVTGLGRRLDSQNGSGRRSSVDDWHEVMPPGEWTHLAASFDFDLGLIELFKNGRLLESEETDVENWELSEEVDYTSATNPAGIKIGGSHPDDSQEQNPFNGRIDELTFFNRVLTPREVDRLYATLSGQPGDYNGDGQVDAGDYSVWRDTEGSIVDLRADGDGDGVVGPGDYALWVDHYGQSFTPALSTAVPSPAGLPLLTLLLLVCCPVHTRPGRE